MGRGAGAFENKTLEQRAVKRQQLVGRECVGDNDGGFGENSGAAAGVTAFEFVDDLDAKLLDVERALTDEGAFRAAEDLREVTAGGCDGSGGGLAGIDGVFEFVLERVVGEDGEVRSEDGGRRSVGRGVNARLDTAADLIQRGGKARSFDGGARARR